jgi:hypothetical protein
MCILGVARRLSNDRYALRSIDELNLLGDEQQVGLALFNFSKSPEA